METKSCFSNLLDPYRAGIEIGEQFNELQPEVIFLFTSIHYKGSIELSEAIYEVLDSKNLIIIGNTGDGIYETNSVENVGISALGINSYGKITWHINYKTGIGESPYESAKKCITELQSMSKTSSKLFFIASDFRTDGSTIIDAITSCTDAPVIGGLAADDYSMTHSYVYVNDKVYNDTLAILSAEGDFYFDISISQNMNEVGSTGKITENKGTNVISIDNIPAMDFIEREIGKPIGTVDEGIVTFKLTEADTKNEFQLRSLFLPKSIADKSVHLYGSVKTGMYAKTCFAEPQKIISDVRQISEHIKQLPFIPEASVIVSCAGRKRVLQSKIIEEVNAITQINPELKSIVGYPSMGEIGPIQLNNTYSKTYFHNMTFIILTLGDKIK